MIQSLYPIILVLLGVILYVRKPAWVIYYWLMIPCVVLPIFSLLTFSVSHEDLAVMTNNTFVGTRNLFFVLLVASSFRRKKFPRLYSVLLLLGLAAVFFLLHSFLFSSGVGIFWGNVSELLSQILPLLFFYNERKYLPPVNQLFKFLVVLISAELICALLNIVGIYFYLSAYVPDITILENGSAIMDDESLISGTFYRYNSMSNYITTIYLFIALEYFANRSISSKLFYLLSFIVGLLVLISGAKMSVAIMGFTIIGGALFFPKGNKTILMASLFGLFFSISFLLAFNTFGKDVSDNEGINRVVNGFAGFVQSDKDDKESTVGLSTYLIENYFENGFFVGNGLTKRGEMAYGNLGVCTLTHFRADARMAYNLVEFGIIGSLLYLFFFFSTCTVLDRNLRLREKKKLWFCFLYFFLLTLTEPGFFDRTCYPMVFLYMCVCLLPKKKVRRKLLIPLQTENETVHTTSL